MRKIGLTLFISLLLCGCRTTRTLYDEIPFETPRPVMPERLELRDVNWRFFLFEEVAYFSLDNENYLNLSKNIVDVQAYVQKLRLVIDLYQKND